MVASSPRCTVHLEPSHARLDGPPEAVLLVADALTVDNPRARGPYGDGKRRFLRRPGNSFEAGLASRVTTALRAAGYDVTLDQPHRPAFPALAPPPTTIAWRPSQLHGIEVALRERRVVLQMPTASGKTKMAGEIARRHGGRGLWTVPTRALLAQTTAVLSAQLPGVPIGRIGDGACEVRQLTVGIIASVSRAVEAPYLRTVDFLIVDEAHHGGAATWGATARACVNAWTKIGLSGTAASVARDPVRMLLMEGALGPIVTLSDAVTQIAQGHVARPVIRFLTPVADSYPTYEQVRDLTLPDWRRDPRRLASCGARLQAITYDLGIVRNAARNRMALGAACQHARAGARVVVLSLLVAHARALHAWFRQGAPDVPAWQLDGRQESKARTADVLGQFRMAARGGVLFVTPFFREGLDLPEVDVLVNVAGGKAESDLLQALGRALRPRPDKTKVLVYDFLDGGNPNSRRPDKDYLQRQALERARILREQGYEVSGRV